ncbi:CASP-like protein 4D1 isoform X1 [Ricinus communis]|uniref:CASP-like protein 4D1 isoform X1 n=1 Tax=Ricinus communis TaxID=3988 RepID=UPI00201AEA69|nr:CASP-like protein 4D1 isoform X1 [Ricinus communis]
MASKSILVSCVVIRLLTLGALAAAIVVLVTNQFRSNIDNSKTIFTDVIAYRFVFAASALGCLYTLIQLPFALYYAYKEKRLIQNDFLPNLDFYGDKMVAIVLACGAGAGLAVTLELKGILKEYYNDFSDIPEIDEQRSKSIRFLNRGYIASGLLLLGCACMVILSVFSSINRTSTKKSGFFG